MVLAVIGPIDPGEAWAAVLGIKPVLTKRVEEITDGQKAEVVTLVETIKKRAKSLCNDGIVGTSFELVDYSTVLQQTSEKMDIPQVEAMIKPLPSEDKLAYMHCANQAFLLLQSTIPKQPWKTFSGTENLPPDLTELAQFSELYAGLEDPIRFIFGSIADGSMVREIAKALQGVFPTLTSAITSAITEASTDRTIKRKSYALPWKAEIGMSAWKGAPVEVPAPSPEAPPPPKESGKEAAEADKGVLSPAQRIDA